MLCAAVLASLSIGPAATAQGVPSHQQYPSRPPSPTSLHDPQPGPFIVHLDGRGDIAPGQHGVIANAVRVWSGATLASFVICFYSPDGSKGWQGAGKALAAVSRDLKAEGAKVVVTPNGGICDSSNLLRQRETYVEVMGVVLL